jgi:hypothetical protein
MDFSTEEKEPDDRFVYEVVVYTGVLHVIEAPNMEEAMKAAFDREDGFLVHLKTRCHLVGNGQDWVEF